MVGLVSVLVDDDEKELVEPTTMLCLLQRF